jgi:hypothetical protein
MVRKAPLLIAAAVILGTVSAASAQTWKYDQTPDNTLSYGPKAGEPAAQRATPASAPVMGGPYWQHDQTPDNTMSYGARSAR